MKAELAYLGCRLLCSVANFSVSDYFLFSNSKIRREIFCCNLDFIKLLTNTSRYLNITLFLVIIRTRLHVAFKCSSANVRVYQTIFLKKLTKF